MDNATSVDELSRQFRSAVISGDHEFASRLSRAYIDALQRAWQALPAGERATSTLPSQARELLDWARGATMIQRTIASDQLSVIRKVGGYQPQSGRGAFTYQG